VKIRLLLIVACFVFLGVVNCPLFAQSFKPGTEPHGFKDLKWGAKKSGIKGMKYLKDAEIGGSYPDDLVHPDGNPAVDKIQVYERTGDKLRFGGATLRSIRYGFWNGKLCEVTLASNGSENWGALKRVLFPKFGRVPLVNLSTDPSPMSPEVEYYIWMGKISEMELIYQPTTRVSELWTGSAVLRDRMFREARKKTKEPKAQTQPP